MLAGRARTCITSPKRVLTNRSYGSWAVCTISHFNAYTGVICEGEPRTLVVDSLLLPSATYQPVPLLLFSLPSFRSTNDTSWTISREKSIPKQKEKRIEKPIWTILGRMSVK